MDLGGIENRDWRVGWADQQANFRTAKDDALGSFCHKFADDCAINIA